MNKINSNNGTNFDNKNKYEKNEIVGNEINIKDLTDVKAKETKEQSWYDYAKSFVWEAEVSFASKFVFDYFVWPALKEYVAPLTMGNTFVLDAAKVFFQGAFMAGCKNMDIGALYDQFIESFYASEEDTEIIEEAENETPKPKQESLLDKSIYKGTVKMVGFVPQEVIKRTTGMKIPNVYFSSFVDTFYTNKNNDDLKQRTAKSMEVAVTSGIKKQISVAFVEKQNDFIKSLF